MKLLEGSFGRRIGCADCSKMSGRQTIHYKGKDYYGPGITLRKRVNEKETRICLLPKV